MKIKKLFPRFLFILITFVSVINSEPVSCQASKNDSLGKIETTDIKRLAIENKHSANSWWYTWLVGYSAATVVQTGIAITSPELSTRQDMWNGAATTFLGVAGLLLTPLVPTEDQVNKLMSQGKDAGHIYTDAEFSEVMLREIARREKFGRSWKVHAVTLGVNVASGLVTWLGFDRSFSDGMVTFAINTAITEAQIWSQPIRASKDYNRYIQLHNNGKLAGPPVPSRQWIIGATPGGVNVRLRF